MSLEQEAQRGKLAQEVLDNEVYAEAHAAIEAEIIHLWRESRVAEDREQLHQLLGLHVKLKSAIEGVMRSGEIASAELRRKQSKAEQMAVYSIR